MLANLFKTFALLITVPLIIVSCSGQKDKSELDAKSKAEQNENQDYLKTTMPSLLGYIHETYNGISRVISYEDKSDRKSKYIAIVFETTQGDISAINYHYEGEYNNSVLTQQHPFLVLCKKDNGCKDCGFQVTDEGTICGCNDKTNENPCMLEIDHITDFDFYANYHELGIDLVKEYITK